MGIAHCYGYCKCCSGVLLITPMHTNVQLGVSHILMHNSVYNTLAHSTVTNDDVGLHE